MAVAHDTDKLSAVFDQSAITESYTPVGTARGIVVAIAQAGLNNDLMNGVTYGGVAMTRVRSDVQPVGGEGGRSYKYFLGSGIPTGTQNVVITPSNSFSAKKRAVISSVTAGRDTQVDANNGAGVSNGSNPSLSVSPTATDAEIYYVLESGIDNTTTAVTGGATHQFATQLSPTFPSANTAIGEWARKHVSAAGSTSIGYTLTSSTYAHSIVAISEVAATTADLVGTAAAAFTAEGHLKAPLSGQADTTFTASATPTQAARLQGSSAATFSVTIAPPTAKANLVGSSPIVFAAFGALDETTVPLVGSAAAIFSASVAPPTGVANLVGLAAVKAILAGELTRVVPTPRITETFQERWESGRHLAEAKPGQRTQVRLGRFFRRYAPWPTPDPVYEMDASYADQEPEVWQAFWTPITDWMDVPNVRDVRLEKQLTAKGIQSATMILDNIVYQAEDDGWRSIRRGYLAPLRGYAAPGRDLMVDDLGDDVEQNEWFKLLARASQVRIFQSYGDQEVKVFTGLIDDVDSTSRPDMLTVVARDFGAILSDERMFGFNKDPIVKDPVVFVDRDEADSIRKVGDTEAASSEYNAAHAAEKVGDGDGDTAWWSAAHSTQAFTEYVQIRLPQGRYSDYVLWCDVDGLDAYVSLYARNLDDGSPPTMNGVDISEGWQGAGSIPGANGGIPYLRNFSPDDERHTRDLTVDEDEFRVGEDSILRLSFRNLQNAPGIGSDYRAGVINLRGRRRKLSQEARKRRWIVVGDVADVVKQILRWAGFKEWEVETTGVPLKKRLVVNRGMTYMDVIDKCKEAVGYEFFMADPTTWEDTLGVPVFRKTRALQPGFDPVLTIEDRQLLTGVQVQQSKEPLAYIIRVRGRESADGARLGSSPVRRVMFTFRPPWSYQLETNELDDLAGVIKHLIHTNPQFKTVDDCKFAAYLIALQEALASVRATVQAPAHPGADLDDHVDLVDLGTGVTSRLIVQTRASTFSRTKQGTKWTMELGGGLVDVPDVIDMVEIINNARRGD